MTKLELLLAKDARDTAWAHGVLAKAAATAAAPVTSSEERLIKAMRDNAGVAHIAVAQGQRSLVMEAALRDLAAGVADAINGGALAKANAANVDESTQPDTASLADDLDLKPSFSGLDVARKVPMRRHQVTGRLQAADRPNVLHAGAFGAIDARASGNASA